MSEMLIGVAQGFPWVVVAIGIARGLYLTGKGTVANARGGLRAVCAERLTRKGINMLGAAGSCGALVQMLIVWPLPV